MNITETIIPDLKIAKPIRHGDDRGWLAQTWSAALAESLGFHGSWVQENFVYSRAAGTLRGLHYQAPPAAQAKLVQVIRGAIFDVAVDIRRGSPTFGRHAGVRLDRETGSQVYVPAGFAHGYLTLEPDTEVLYKLGAPYAPQLERGVRWDDPAIGIAWPEVDALSINDRDRRLPLLADAATPFEYARP